MTLRDSTTDLISCVYKRTGRGEGAGAFGWAVNDLKVLQSRASQALSILDRFHIMKKFGEAIDKVRAEEARQMKQDGYEEVLKNSRWCLLKRKAKLTMREAYGFKDYETIQIALYHQLGKLPEPKTTHKFC